MADTAGVEDGFAVVVGALGLVAGLVVLDLLELDAGAEVRGLLLRTSVALLLDDPLLETVKLDTRKSTKGSRL